MMKEKTEKSCIAYGEDAFKVNSSMKQNLKFHGRG